MAGPEVTYTPQSANAILPEVRSRLHALRDAYALIAGHRAKVQSAAGGNGGDREAAHWLEASREVARELRWFADAAIVVRDIEQGLIDFPSVREGRQVFLCWRFGEDSVGFWHDLDTGFQGRRPL